MNPAPSAAADNPHDASASPPTGARKKASGSIAKRACDQCKFRKIKCSLSQPCRACLSMGFECTFYQPQKKRGPTGHRVSQIRQQQTTHLAQKSPQPRTQAQAQAQTQTQTQTQAQAQAQAHSPGSAADAFAYPTGPSPAAAREPGRMEAIPMPEAAAAAQWPVQTPMNGNGLASATTATAPVGADWTAGVPAAPPLDPHTHGAMSWGKYGDAEYWLPDNLDAQVPIFDFPGTNVYLKPSLPSMVQAESDAPDMESHQASPTSSTSIPISSLTPHPPEEDSRPRSVWPPSIIEANMIPWIDVYFDRLHPTLPVINRSSLFIRMLSQEHRRNPQFGAMLLSLCAFSLTQPIEIDERPTSSSRAGQARSMMHEATKMRSCSDFGEHPTIEAVLTSFFLFGCLFGSNQHNAAWLRLREALDLAATLGLNDPNCYPELSSEEKGQRLRTYLVLSITERAYALQRQHPITFRGKPGFTMRSVHEFIHSASHRLVSGIIVHNEHDAEGMMGLARLMELFDAIDEEVVDCWNRRCHIDSGYCEKLTAAKALEIHQNLGRLNTAERYKGYDWFERTKSAPHEAQAAHQGVGLRETQCADIFITQKWLQNRLWVLCSTHGLLTPVSDHVELTLNFAILIANDTLQICKSLRIGSMEAHGIGIVEKIFDIITSALDISASINPSLGGSNFAASSLCQGLAGDYMLLLTSLRGGNHPFLERYRAYLGSLASASASSSAVGAGWGQQ